MNEIEKIGMYTTDEILEFMTNGEGRGFLGRSMFDAMYFKIKDLQSKIDKANEILDTLCIVKPYESVNGEFHKYYRPIKNTTKQETYKALYELKDILKDDK